MENYIKNTHIKYHEEILPELLWIAYICNKYTFKKAYKLYTSVCNQVDKLQTNKKNHYFLGYISEFNIYQNEQYEKLKKIININKDAFPEKFISIISKYDKSPYVFKKSTKIDVKLRSINN